MLPTPGWGPCSLSAPPLTLNSTRVPSSPASSHLQRGTMTSGTGSCRRSSWLFRSGGTGLRDPLIPSLCGLTIRTSLTSVLPVGSTRARPGGHCSWGVSTLRSPTDRDPRTNRWVIMRECYSPSRGSLWQETHDESYPRLVCSVS